MPSYRFSLYRAYQSIQRPGIVLVVAAGFIFAYDNEIRKLMFDISSGPNSFYSPEAYSYFNRKGYALPPQRSPDEAMNCFKAVMKLADMGGRAAEAVPILIASFPQAVHVTKVMNVHYRGEGSFEDWVQTYITSESNKFLLASPFLDYTAMSRCEPFIVSTHEVVKINGEPVTIPTRDLVDIYVIHTVFFGACALSTITAERFGVDRAKWQEWWNATTSATSASSPLAAGPSSARLRSGQLFSDIVQHGKYRMFLSTGDSLVGRVEAKDDTSLIIETSEGKAFTFRASIILRYEYLEPPRTSISSSGKAAAGDSLPFSFEDLRKRTFEGKQLEVRLNSGTVFRGTLAEIDSQSMKLRVEKSVIPITREVVANIRIVPLPPETDTLKKPAKSGQLKEDTVVVKTVETDEWGKPGPDSTFTGSIIREENEYIIIATAGAGNRKIPRGRIVRIVKHSAESYESVIKRYAQPLFCPDDMFLVDLPPGKPGRPFFKICVDRYEYPNVKGAAPKVNVSYDEAGALCRKRGKRLCTAEEWQWACSGMEGYTYPYGWNHEKDKCNTEGDRLAEASGSRHNCVSKFGGYDMVGNVFEWVVGPGNQPSMMGGPYSKCPTVTEGVGGSAKPHSGLRCCKGN